MDKEILDYKGISMLLLEKILELYWKPLREYLNAKPELIKTFPGFLLNPEKIIFYFSKTHLAIEYVGSEKVQEINNSFNFSVEIRDFTFIDDNIVESIVGFKYDDSTFNKTFELPRYSENLIMPTNRGFDKLHELGWDFIAQNGIIAFNAGNFEIPRDTPSRYVNAFFFDCENDSLKTRHIKWLECIPASFSDDNSEYDSFNFNIGFLNNLVNIDAHYQYPLPEDSDFKYVKLPQINRFIELFGNKNTHEVELTNFLEKDENKFILLMAFFGKNVHSQLKCEWQSDERKPIKPDFFIEQPNGYANIVEFKLPEFKSRSLIGKPNRETFSAELNSYISQTRVYKNYFNDPNNRKWFKEKYKFNVHNPKRILVIGRRWDFNNDEWREIVSDFRDVEIVTYDDLVDGLFAQFYN
ncbi:Shedu anti-phage system protein SduA domain-containing protein [Chryseobacterium gambrini]|uniref:Shedu anti-phage system protein SduA domain-containing protein n=1 Tax=Chryseobacterium gambrini TaxID=373672 RepID=UPI0025B42D42|nr:Shedu anti-phage system protein SduA domain-containing protein [Chryseobacterium gambrini]MDN4029815.1 DUF4263 domain-containing protein [Chryseobacterium gambrini]